MYIYILTSRFYVSFNTLNELVLDLSELAFLTKNCVLMLFLKGRTFLITRASDIQGISLKILPHTSCGCKLAYS